MKIIVSLIVLGLVLFSASADAQTRKRNKSEKPKTVKPIPKTISAGVVNGEATNLVRPEFPKIARMANVYGRVSVKVLIDETGTVISGEAISGHLLLRGAAVKAALESKFQPMTLSGNPVRMSGFIIYNFIPKQWNWLEIGYALVFNSYYYRIGDMLDLLPSEFSEESKYFEKVKNEPDFEEIFISSIRAKLMNDEKSSWLFSAGLLIGKVKNICCRKNSEMQDLAQEIKVHLLSKPKNINSSLISALEEFILLAENPNLDTYSPTEGSKIYQLLINVESKFPFWGR